MRSERGPGEIPGRVSEQTHPARAQPVLTVARSQRSITDPNHFWKNHIFQAFVEEPLLLILNPEGNVEKKRCEKYTDSGEYG